MTLRRLQLLHDCAHNIMPIADAIVEPLTWVDNELQLDGRKLLLTFVGLLETAAFFDPDGSPLPVASLKITPLRYFDTLASDFLRTKYSRNAVFKRPPATVRFTVPQPVQPDGTVSDHGIVVLLHLTQLSSNFSSVRTMPRTRTVIRTNAGR